ncbi:hypothetical protein GI374_00290 [Paracoccus sp. S-4012]|nr:hypothetical protein [Paracoccus sp. S-4012]
MLTTIFAQGTTVDAEPSGGTGNAAAASGDTCDGPRDQRRGPARGLGLWIAETRREVLAVGDDRTAQPGLQDIPIAVVDDPRGFPEAITAAFPEARVQTCVGIWSASP